MSVSGISLALGITEYELFVRAHRSFGPADRTTLDRDFRRYEISGSEPDYVRGFCIAHQAEVLRLRQHLTGPQIPLAPSHWSAPIG